MGEVLCRGAAIPHAAPCSMNLRLASECAVAHAAADVPYRPPGSALTRAMMGRGRRSDAMRAGWNIRRPVVAACARTASYAYADEPFPRRRVTIEAIRRFNGGHCLLRGCPPPSAPGDWAIG